MRRIIICFGVCLLASTLPLPARDKQQQADALAMIRKATELSNIRAEGSSPFWLHASVRLIQMGGGTVDGGYSLVWAAPDKWRSQVSFGNFSDIHGRDQSVLWHSRNFIFEPFKIIEVLALVGVGPGDKEFQKNLNLKIRERAFPGGRLECVERKSAGGAESDFCFNPASGTLALRTDRFETAEFRDYAPFGDKTYPRNMTITIQGQPSISVTVDKLTTLDQFDERQFSPPDNAEKEPVCGTRKEARPVDVLALWHTLLGPHYTTSNPRKPMAYFEIGPDGRVVHAFLLERDGSVSSTTARWPIEQLRFEPATCNGKPVPDALILLVPPY